MTTQTRSGRVDPPAPTDAAPASPEASTTDGGMPAEVLTVALSLSLWVASGSLALAIVDGLGEQPVRRAVVGLMLVAVWAVALLMRAKLCSALQAQPWFVAAFAPVLLFVVATDGLVGSPYAAVTLTTVGIAVVVARARTVWLCVLALGVSYAAAALAEGSPAELADHGQLGTVVGALVSYPVAATLLLGLRRRFTRFVENVEPTLEVIRAGPPASTPALERALRGVPLTLAPGPVSAGLTPAERRVVEGLAGGRTPKQLAFAWGVSINTVRSQISSAKRKTGARTLRELAAQSALLDWAEELDHAR